MMVVVVVRKVVSLWAGIHKGLWNYSCQSLRVSDEELQLNELPELRVIISSVKIFHLNSPSFYEYQPLSYNEGDAIGQKVEYHNSAHTHTLYFITHPKFDRGNIKPWLVQSPPHGHTI